MEEKVSVFGMMHGEPGFLVPVHREGESIYDSWLESKRKTKELRAELCQNKKTRD